MIFAIILISIFKFKKESFPQKLYEEIWHSKICIFQLYNQCVCTDRDLCYTGTTSFYSPFKKSGYSKGMNGKNWTDNLISNRNCKHMVFCSTDILLPKLFSPTVKKMVFCYQNRSDHLTYCEKRIF